MMLNSSNTLRYVEPQIWPNAERRSGIDRRDRPTPFFSRYWLKGKRRTGRREGEHSNIYVDRYTGGELGLVCGILLLSVLDLVFTLLHLNAGGTEANPVMAWVLAWGGHGAFSWVKLATTVLGLMILLFHVRFRKVRNLLTFAFLLYAGVFVFHIYLTFLRAGMA